MSRNNTNPSDVASTRWTQGEYFCLLIPRLGLLIHSGSGQSRSSDKRAALRRQLEDLREDVRRMTVEDSRNLKSTQDLIEGTTGSVRSVLGMVEEVKGQMGGLKEDARDMMKTVGK